MVTIDPRSRGTRYVADETGAPPIPPAGGYRGARRMPTASAASAAPEIPDLSKRPPSSWLGWASLAVSCGFALVLLIMLGTNAVDALFGMNMLALQIAVAAVVILSIFTPRGRFLGSIALAVALVLNVATVGGLATARTQATGDSAPVVQHVDDKWVDYPGIKDVSPDSILTQPSLEEVQADSESFMQEVRERLTQKYGFTWTSQPGSVKTMRNGYGGQSMLQEYRSDIWSTNEAVHGADLKMQIMLEIDDVLAEHGGGYFTALNDPAEAGRDDSIIEKLYGSTDPDTQAVWEWGAFIGTHASFYADIYDLDNDPDGTFRQAREAANKRTGEPLEGVQLLVVDDQLLSEKDVQAFSDKIKEF